MPPEPRRKRSLEANRASRGAAKRRAPCLAGCVAIALSSTQAQAQLDVTSVFAKNPEVVEALSRVHDSGSFLTFEAAPASALQCAGAQTLRGVTTSPGISVLKASALGRASTLGPLQTDTACNGPRLFWAAPKRLLLDQARGWVGLEALEKLRADANLPRLTGRDVVIGVVDSGVDFEHPDLRNSDGTTRIAWLIDFGSSPLGLHPELEADFGCSSATPLSATSLDVPCAILDATMIDRLLRGQPVQAADGAVVDLPADRLGHGTHVASLAAGNGRADSSWTGIAPEATLIVARIASNGAQVSDHDVLLATRFVFDRAAELGMPAVVNLSLGGDFGPHDGQASTDVALAELAQGAGRAIVVASGNSGALYQAPSKDYPSPVGIHTEVHLAEQSRARVPVLLPEVVGPSEGVLLIWIEGELGDDFAVGLEDAAGNSLAPLVPPGQSIALQDDRSEIVIVNRDATEFVYSAEDQARGAALVVFGTFEASSVLAVRLEGTGNAHLWLQSNGGIGPEAGSEGAAFPGATSSSTVGLPATSAELIAVGATLNRTRWTSRDSGAVELFDFGNPEWFEPDEPAFFSSRGPNRAGHLKPDLLAPGMAVVGALSRAADPAQTSAVGYSMFFASPLCSDSLTCSVVSDHYAAAVGTSMASPLVSGAVALLLERDPTLTQAELLGLLKAGARPLPQLLGKRGAAEPGVLDVAQSLRALEQLRSPEATQPPSERSWLALSDELVRPDPALRLAVDLHLRDAQGRLSALAQVDELDVRITNGEVVGELRSPAPGLVSFAVAPAAASNGELLTLAVWHHGRQLTSRSLPIALDPGSRARGVSVRGGCAVTSTTHPRSHAPGNPAPGNPAPTWLALALGLFGLGVRRLGVRRLSSPAPRRCLWRRRRNPSGSRCACR